jgi:hypothetical protein
MRPRPVAVVVAVLASLPLWATAAFAQTTPATPPPAAPTSAWAEAVGATPGLVAWWRLDEADGTLAADRAGGNDGTYAAGVQLGAPGLIAGDANTAATLDAGGEAYIDIGDALDFPGLAPFTVEAWIAPGDYQSPYPRILQKDGVDANGNRQGYLVYLNQQTGNLGFERWRDNEPNVVVTAEPIALNRSSHVVAAFDGSTMRLYVNGALAGEAAAAQELADNPFGMRLGARSDGESPFFGTLDEVAVYEGALDADTVLAHFEAGTAGGAGQPASAAPSAATPAAAQPAVATPAVVVVAEPTAAAPEPTEPAEQVIIGPPAPTPDPAAPAPTAPASPIAVETPVAVETPAAAAETPVAGETPAAAEPTAPAAQTPAPAEPTPEPLPATTTAEVNFRAGPSTDTVIISTLPAGTAVQATGEVVDGFVEVVVDGRSGWIFADFLAYE